MSEPEPNEPINNHALEQEMTSILDRVKALEQAVKNENDSDYKNRQIRINVWLTVLTGCLVLTSLLAIYISKGASDTATAAMNNSIEFFRVDERAWVEIEPIKPILHSTPNGNFGAVFKYEIYLKNVGKTVARDIVMRAITPGGPLEMGDDANSMRRMQDILMREFPEHNNRVPKILAPNTTSSVPLILHGQAAGSIGNGYHSFLVGRIDYLDAFSAKHWMTFCFFVSNARGELRNCVEGNTEDRNPETLQETRN